MNDLMILAANWWEPGQNGVLDVGDISAMFMFFLAVVGAVTALSRWWLKQLRTMIREEVEEFTKPIQPHANGGKSLPDVNRKVDSLEKMLCELKESQDETREMLVSFILKQTTDKDE